MESARKDHPKVSGGGGGRKVGICSYLVMLTMESARKDHPRGSGGGEGWNLQLPGRSHHGVR
jgi:hypothetical protein